MFNHSGLINPNEALLNNSSRKRASECLAQLQPITQPLCPEHYLSRYPKGRFRKTRRFTENAQHPQGVPLFDLEENDEQQTLTFTPLSGNARKISGENRRSSMHAPKSMWPGYDAQDTAGLNHNLPRNIQHMPRVNSYFDLDTWQLENEFVPSEFMNESKTNIRFNDSFQPLKSDIRYRFDFKALSRAEPETKSEQADSLTTSLSQSDCYVKKGAWTNEEDELLMRFGSMANAKNWTEIAEKIPGRTAKQCRERWCFNLDPTINKELWTPEEDTLLIKKQVEIGNKWAQIATLLPGRTENAVKTRFKSIVRAKKREWRPSEDQLLLALQKSHGANWEGIAAKMEGHRTKHAVKMRFKELQAGLCLLSLPEYGSARQTVREMYYPQETLQEISARYQQMAKGTTTTVSPPGYSHSFEHESHGPSLKLEENAFDRTFDDLFCAMYAEEEPIRMA